MKTVMLRGSTADLSLDEMWNRISDVQNYPRRIKYCRKVWDVDVREGGGYSDTTTLLWVPFTIHHHIAELHYPTRIRYELDHTNGWTSTQTFTFSTAGDVTTLEARIDYDFGNFLYNQLFGRLLKPRLVSMLRSCFPEAQSERVI